MKNTRYLPLLLALAVFLCACGKVTEAQVTTEASVPTEATMPAESLPTTVSTETVHSRLYLPEYTAQQIAEYFGDVVLNVEYSDGTGSPELVKKWLSPIYYQIYGAASDTDREVIDTLCRQLNDIPGFPGIFPAESEEQENVSISFLEPEEFTDSFSDVIGGEEATGGAQFWFYVHTNQLHTARIGVRTDLDQSVRSSVLQEEMINILGISDTTLRTDSITYQYSDDNTALSDVDLVILNLLYDPAIACGFEPEDCSAVIEALYF